MIVVIRPSDIEGLPDLCVAQCCTLKIDESDRRVWICRVAGGVTIERYVDRKWQISAGSCTSKSVAEDAS